MIKYYATLLIVFSVLMTDAKTDSVGLAPYVKVFEAGDDSKFRVLYHSPLIGNVTIRILNQKGNKVHEDIVYRTDRFTRDYDFGKLPEGEYTFRVKSGGEVYDRQITLDRWNGEGLVIAEVDGDIRLTGPNRSGSALTVLLTDQYGNSLYKDKMIDQAYLSRLYKFDDPNIKNVSVLIYNKGNLIKEVNVEL